MLVITYPGMHTQSREVLSSVILEDYQQRTQQDRAQFLAELVEMLVEKRVLSLSDLFALGLPNMEVDIEVADQ